MDPDLWPLLAGAVAAAGVVALDRAIVRRRKRRNFHSRCALCNAELDWQNFEEIAIGGGDIAGVTGRVCRRCARLQRVVAWSVGIGLLLACAATIVLVR